MRIIISPAKQMKVDTDSLPIKTMPIFIEKANFLKNKIREQSKEVQQRLWNCNEKIAKENRERFLNMELETAKTPAILSYDGIQYKHMKPSVFKENEIDYIDKKLRIISGLYGVLAPYDGVVPYRLEMKSDTVDLGIKSLYDYWNDDIYKEVIDESNIILNLASKEYSKVVEPYLTKKDIFIDCVFGEFKNGEVVQKATYAKMARGDMVRFLAENNIEKIEEIKKFDIGGYRFYKEYSKQTKFVFIK